MRSVMIAALFAAAGGAAAGTTYAWDAYSGGGNMRGGTMTSVSTSFNTASEVFRWEVTYSNQITEGFTLAVNDGPNPKGTRGELALIYFDANGFDSSGNSGDVNVTAYEYSGNNDSQSWDNPGVLLNQSGDPGFIRSASATDNNVDGTRTFVLEFDASTINSFYDTTDWEGVGFDSSIGVWFHSFKDLNTAYDANGKLTQWSGVDGWLDFSNQNTTIIPVPLAGTMGAAGLGLVATRRRR